MADDLDRLTKLGRALAHPVRARILLAFHATDGPLRPVELSRMLDVPLGVASYHVRTLDQLGLLTLSGLTAVRGAIAHDYRLADDVGTALAAFGR